VYSVKNASRQQGLGPAPAAIRGRRMSAARASVLEMLQAQSEPTTLAALARSAGLHPNSVREHLEALVAGGLATRSPARPSGRGRPAWLYQATDADPEGPSEYAGLASALAEAIHHRSPAPAEDALAAGRRWGQDLAHRRGATAGRTARHEVVSLLDDLGFAPEADRRAATVRLTRCPLLEAAHRYPDVVCAVHLGLTRGALEEYGTDAESVRLLPFAEPGACLLHLTAPQ
jgi:predicted ArsR family transcriptional regulator